MKKASFSSIGLALLAFALPLSAEAHQVGGYGFASGATHPLFGLDHLLAMAAVGAIAVRMGGKALWVIPATFVAAMIGGGMIAFSGATLPGVEVAIGLSVLISGIVMAAGKDIHFRSVAVATSFFALFHGHAHGQEMPLLAHPALYASGFVFSTVAIHGTGVLVGRYIAKTRLSAEVFRFAGASVGLAGIFFLIG